MGGDFGEGGADGLGDGDGVITALVGQQDAEFVAALAHDGVVLANHAFDGARNRDQQLIAGGVPELVVEWFEAVEIEDEDGERPAGAVVACQLVREALGE